MPHSAYHRPRSLQAGRRTCNRYFPAFIKYVTIRGARRHFPMRNYALSFLLGDGGSLNRYTWRDLRRSDYQRVFLSRTKGCKCQYTNALGAIYQLTIPDVRSHHPLRRIFARKVATQVASKHARMHLSSSTPATSSSFPRTHAVGILIVTPAAPVCLLPFNSMAYVITLANFKGGVGKSTIAVNLSDALATDLDSKVLLVDADPRKGSLKWFKRREQDSLPFDLTACDDPRLYALVPPIVKRGGYEYTLIDTPAGGSAITRAGIVIADLVVVPVQPSLADFDFAEELMPVLQEVATMHPLEVAVIISRRKSGRNSFSEEASRVAKQFFEAPGISLRVFESEIYERLDIQKSYAKGVTVREHSKRSKSAGEFNELMKEVVTCLRSQPAEV